MKRKVWYMLGIGLCLMAAQPVFAQVQADIHKYTSCQYCGMDRGKFGYSRVLIEYDDGSIIATCSIHCAVVDLALNIDKTPKAILMGDYETKKLIDAENAVWVIGGNKMGVMTRRAKWAFEKKGDAEKFVSENGGTLVAFDEVMKAAYEDMYQDTKMIREKRKMTKKSMEERKHQ
jgi:copper chaperone NosL